VRHHDHGGLVEGMAAASTISREAGRGSTSLDTPSSSTAFSSQLAQQPPRIAQAVIEDTAGHIKKGTDKRVTQRISNRQSFFLRRHDALMTQHGQLLRNDRLLQRELLL
jgi:hypothetical protein